MSDTERMLSLALIHAASDPGVTREALEEIQGLAKDPQRLRALLESEGLGGEEGEGDEEEEPDPEDVPIGKRYRGSLRPADLIIGKRYRPTVTKAATLPPGKVESDEDTGPALARWYAGWFEALEASGLEVSESDLASAEDELDGTGWCVGRDDDGEWEARATRSLGKKSWRFAHLTKAAQRAPSGYNRASPFHFNGKDYVGGQFIPGKAIEEASPQDRAKLQAAKEAESKKAEASKAARGATAVDPVALAHTLSQHAGAVELTKAERGNAARAYAALQRHHGDLTLHRIGELAARAEQAWRSVTDDDPNSEGLRSYWTRQLAAMAGWVERAKGAGLTGEARGKPADAVAEEASEGPVAEATATEGGLGGHSREEAEAKAREYWDSRKESRGQGQPRPPVDPASRPDQAASEKTENRVRARNIVNGGEFGPNGEFYPAGTFFNLTEQGKQKPLPAGAGTVTPPDAGTKQEDDGAGSGMPGTASQEALREQAREKADRAKHRKEMLALQSSPLGRMFRWNDGGHDRAPTIDENTIFLTPWRDFLQGVGNDGARKIYERLQPTLTPEAVEAQQWIDHVPDTLPKKHHKDFPDSRRAWHALQSAVLEAKTLDDLKAISQLLTGLQHEAHGVTPEEMSNLTEQARAAQMYPNKFAGRTDSGEKVLAGAGFVRKRPDGTYETLSMAQARAAMGASPTAAEASPAAAEASPVAPPDPHFTGTVTGKDGRTYRFVDGKRVAGDQSTEIPVDNGAVAGRIPPGDENTGGTTMSQELNAAQVRMQSEAVAHAQGRADRLRARGMVEDADHYAAVADYLRTAGADFWVKQGTGRRVEEIALVAGELVGKEPAPVAPSAPAVPAVDDVAASKARWDAIDARVRPALVERLKASAGGATPAQAEYRANLLRVEFDGLSRVPTQGLANVQLMQRLYLAESMPAPTDKADASKQIDALRSGVMVYARANQEWAREMMTRLSGIAGQQGEKLADLFSQRYATLSNDEKMVAQRSNQNYYELVIRPALGLA